MPEVRRASKYGFCSGVRLADLKVRRFVADGGAGKILGQVVHNERVVADLEALGVATVDRLDEVAEGTVVFSAHGVPPSFHTRARRRGLTVLDTTCPFVYDIHDEAEAARIAGEHLVFIGDPKHREVVGYTHDLAPGSFHIVATLADVAAIDWTAYHQGVRIFYQTTLNADDYEEVARAIERAVPQVQRAATICYATKENQEAARELASAPEVDVIVVVGGRHSANTRHLWELCERSKPSYLVHDLDDLDESWFANARVVGLTAGASTPDNLIDEVEARIVACCAVPA
jgi:4-hydroxy-3-methylbut-2-enyl diphosphate reductase